MEINLINLEPNLKKWARSKAIMASVIIVQFICCLICVVLSIQQTQVINDSSNVKVLKTFMSGWTYAVCRNDLIQLLSPFLFDFTVSHFEQELGQLGCPWRERNSIIRLTVLALQIITSLWMFFILITGHQKKFWPVFYWGQWGLFVLIWAMFVIDSEGFYNGYCACDGNFNVTGYGPVVLGLLNAKFTTTLPPYFYGPYRPNWQYQQYDDSTVVAWDLAIVDGCYTTPFVYVPMTEAAIIVSTYFLFRMARLYSFDKKNIDQDEDIAKEDIDQGCFPKPKKSKKSVHKTPKRKKKKDSMAEQDGNRENHRAYGVSTNNPFGTANEPAYNPQATEPAHWNARKETYEQNYS